MAKINNLKDNSIGAFDDELNALVNQIKKGDAQLKDAEALDPFMEDAAEGLAQLKDWESASKIQQQLNQILDQKIKSKVKRKARRQFALPVSIMAIFLIVLVIVGVWYLINISLK